MSKKVKISKGSAENGEEKKQTEAEAAPTPAGELEPQILERVKEKLPIELKFSVDDPNRFRLHLRNHELFLEAVPGFLMERMKRPEIRSLFGKEAEALLGTPVAVRLTELTTEERGTRDLNELKQFKEVRFLS